MIKRLPQLLLLIIIVPVSLLGQETDYGPGYQMIMMKNPAFTGSEGKGTLRLSYFNFYPGNNYNLHSVYLSYDSYFPAIHGGAGLYLTNDYLGGIVNDIRGGFSYSYFLQAGKNLYINAGLSAAIYHRGFNFNNAVLPDQIDPLGGVSLPPEEILTNSGRTVFDIGTGFLFISGRMFGGFSISHLAEPDLSGTGLSYERLKRKLLLHLSGDFALNNKQTIKVRPLAIAEMQKKYILAGAGAVLESNTLSFNTVFLGNNGGNLDLQTGFSMKAGELIVFYNYRFNILSGNKMMPFSLLHQAGMAFSLNNVEKRKTANTINYPEL